MVGKTLSHYKILEELGRGGMGIVYKAEDTKLDRTVAIKVLPSAALSSEDDRARFYREAKAAAQLHHPHIASVFEIDEAVPEGSKDDDLRPFISMEYIEGETLSERIKKGPLKLEEAVRIASQIASGLEAAHEKDIVHRDIKPQNVMLTKKGDAKVLDFGLALTAQSTRLTRAGSALGTVASMSPEQARGEEVDLRTDIWALGVTLYEMVAGRNPFRGDYEHAVLYAILNEIPEPLTAIRTGVPMDLERLAAKCLAKDADGRYQRVAEILVDLRALRLGSADSSSRSPDVRARTIGSLTRERKGLLVGLIFGVIVGLVGGGGFSRWQRMETALESGAPTPVMGLQLDLPDNAPLSVASGQTSLALSPDGTQLVYVADRQGTTQLVKLNLEDGIPTPIEGTRGAYSPFFSPDGRWIGFFADGWLKKASLRGGSVVDLSEVFHPQGGTWTADNRILFVGKDGGTIFSISDSGADQAPVDTRFGTGKWPAMLPGGQYMLISNSWGYGIDVIDIISGERTRVITGLSGGAGNPRYVSSGHVVYVENARLMAAPFDLGSMMVTADPVPVLDSLRTEPLSAGQYAVSSSGTILYVSGMAGRVGRLTWVNPDGGKEPLPFDPDYFATFSLSPDGSRLAVSVLGHTWDIWIYDLEQGGTSRLALEGNNRSPVWAPDGETLVFSSDRNGAWKLYESRADRVDEARLLPDADRIFWPVSFSPSGDELIYAAWADSSAEQSADLWALPMEGGGAPKIVVGTPFEEGVGRISPTGHYFAYHSGTVEQYELWVQPFPASGDDQRARVSVDGGMDPVWSSDGREIYYLDDETIWAAEIKVPELAVRNRRVVYDGGLMQFPGPVYDLAPDGRILIVESLQQSTPVSRLDVVTGLHGLIARNLARSDSP